MTIKVDLLEPDSEDDRIHVTGITGIDDVGELEDVWSALTCVMDPHSESSTLFAVAKQMFNRYQCAQWRVSLHWPGGLVSRIDYSASGLPTLPSTPTNSFFN